MNSKNFLVYNISACKIFSVTLFLTFSKPWMFFGWIFQSLENPPGSELLTSASLRLNTLFRLCAHV